MSSLLEHLKFEKVPHVVFKRSPLVLALCQLRFSRVAAVADDTVVARFQRAIQNEYPLGDRDDNVDLSLEVGFGEPELRKERSIRWRFTDREDNWTVVLSQNFVALETRAYDEFDDFLSRLRYVLDALMENIRPSAGVRLGLRYINEFRPQDPSWSSIIRAEMLGPLTYQPFAEHANTAIQQLQLVLPEGDNITVRHGVLPTGSVVQPRRGEAMPESSFYLLDFDMFRDFSPPNILSMNTAEICAYVKAYNAAMYQFFCWSVTEEYRSKLEVKRRNND